MPEIADPETEEKQAPLLVDAAQVVENIFAKLPSFMQQTAPVAQVAPAKIESQYEKVRQRMIDDKNLDAPTAQVLDALLDAKVADKEALDSARRKQDQEQNAAQQNQRSVQERSNAAMAEIDRTIAKFATDNPLVGRAKEAIKKNVAEAFNADPTLLKRFHAGDVDYGELNKLALKEINHYLPEGAKKSAGGPAIKNENPGGAAKKGATLDINTLDEKGREFVTAQVNFWKKQPNMDLPKAQAKAIEAYTAAEEKRKSKK